jgi:uncharacterized protein involved in outer membrane biogenesis
MDASQYKPRKKWPLILGGFVGLLAVVYWVATSGWFIKSAILPQVASALGSELVAEDVSLSPFRQLELRQVKLTPRGSEPLFTVELVRVRYGLLAILGGDLKVDEVTIESPTVTIVEKLNGDSNLAKLLAGLKSEPSATKPASTESPKVNLRNFALRNATLRYSKETAAGGVEISEVVGLNLTLDQLGNGQTGKLTLSLSGSSVQGTNRLAAQGEGAFDVGLDAQLMPAAINGQLKLSLGKAEGAFKELANAGAALALDLTATEVKQLKLAFTRGNDTLGTVALNGPYDLAKREARISYTIDGIDKRVLGVVGTASGVGFGNTAVTANGRVDLAQFGQLFASYGKLSVNQFGLVLTNGASPVLDVALDYKFSVNLTEKTALAEKLDVEVKQGGRDLIRGGLDRPMNLAWDRTAPGFREATFTLSLTGLQLADWRALAGPDVPSGTVSLVTKITAERDGRLLKAKLTGGIDRLSGEVAGAKFNQLKVSFSSEGSYEDFVAATLDRSEVIIENGAEQVAKLTAYANHHQQQKILGLQASADVSLPQLLKIHPVEGVEFQRGSALLSFQTGIRPGATNITVNLSASDLTGKLKDAVLTDYVARIQMAADLTLSTYTLQRLTLAAQSGTAPGGSFDVAGKFDPQSKTGDFNFKSVGFNESALGPFVAAAIAPNRLRSISIDGDGLGTIALTGESTFKAQIKLQNFVAEDPEKKLPTTPLALGFSVDAAQRAQTLDLRQFKLELGSTARAENTLLISGKIDLATNNATPSVLSLQSTGLDLTPLFNLFAGPTTNRSAAPASVPAVVSSPADPNQEPAAINLPLKRFDLDLNIAQFFLREVAISNWVTKVKLDNNSVVLEPFSLSLNGAPVRASAKANLGVPGYTYDVSFGAEGVPLRPLNNTFVPDQADKLGGSLVAKFQTKGAGVTGASLQKNLEGSFNFATSNLNLAVSSVQSSTLKAVINTIVSIPDLIRNPGAAVGNLLGRLTGAKPAGGGWVDEITKSPIESINAQGTMGGGKIQLESALVRSPAFEATARGTVTLAAVLTNSALQIPVGVALRRELAQKSGLAAADVATNLTYVALPEFLTLQGTVGKAEPKINYLALAGFAARAGAGLVGGSGKAVIEQGASLVEGVGRLLGGGSKTNAPAATNAPAGNLGAALGNLLGGSRKPTNAPATNQAPTLNPFDLLKPKK